MESVQLRQSMASTDFRARATWGVAIASVVMFMPVAIYHLAEGRFVTAFGTLGVVALLAISCGLIQHGKEHQHVVLFGLMPFGALFLIQLYLFDPVIASFWCYPVVLSSYCMLSQRRAWLASAMIMCVAIPMALMTLPITHAARVIMSVGAVSLFAGIMVRVIDEQSQRLHQQVERDDLTGLLNRSSLKRRLECAIHDNAINGTPMSLLAMDIDHFKKINDSFGHDAGDRVLQESARLLEETVRNGDSVFRLGGEEFLILLHGADAHDAMRVAEGLRQNFNSQIWVGDRRISASIGIAELMLEDDWASWVRHSDSLMYEAKRTGRNRVVSELNVELDSAPSTAAKAETLLENVG